MLRTWLLLLLPPPLSLCLSACLSSLSLPSPLFYQFLSHSPCLLVITHHPLIERKGPVLSTTSQIYKILSAVNTCLQIFCPINDSCVSAFDSGIHIRVYLSYTHFKCDVALYIRTQLLGCRIAREEIAEMSPHSTGLNWLNDDKQSPCQLNRVTGIKV